MRDVQFSKGNFIVVKSWSKKHCYLTIINTKPKTIQHQNPRDFHCHIDNINNMNAAKMLCVWASKISSSKVKVWPSHYPKWMQEGLCRLLYGKQKEGDPSF